MCTLGPHRLAQCRHRRKEVDGRKRTPSSFRSTMPSSWISDVARNKDGASAVLSWRHSRCVAVFRFGAVITPRSRTLASDASFFKVISTASLCGLCLWPQWGDIMRACVRTEPTGFNVVSDRTHCNALFIVFFLQLSSSGEHVDLSKVDDFWQHHWPIWPNVGKTGDAGDSNLTVREALLFIEYSHFVHYNVVM